MNIYRVSALQAAEPELIDSYPEGTGWPTVGMSWVTSDDITVVVTNDDDGSGAHAATVDIYGPSRGAVLAFVAKEWGTDDREWFAEYVEGALEELTLQDIL